MIVRLVPLLGLLLLPLGSVCADTITLDDGRVLEGELLTPDDASVIEIKVTIGDLVAIQRFDRRQVAAIHHGMTPHQTAVAAIHRGILTLGAGGTAEDWLTLARAARDQNEPSLCRELAAKAALCDRRNIEAHHLAGEVLQNGVWMLPREPAVASLEVFFDGRWMPWSERAKLLADAAQAKADSQAARQKLLQMEQQEADLEASQRPPALSPGQRSWASAGTRKAPLAPTGPMAATAVTTTDLADRSSSADTPASATAILVAESTPVAGAW